MGQHADRGKDPGHAQQAHIGRHVRCRKMCYMDSARDAGDVVDAGRAAWFMGSGVQRVDKGILAARSAVEARHRRLDVAPWCIPSIPT